VDVLDPVLLGHGRDSPPRPKLDRSALAKGFLVNREGQAQVLLEVAIVAEEGEEGEEGESGESDESGLEGEEEGEEGEEGEKGEKGEEGEEQGSARTPQAGL